MSLKSWSVCTWKKISRDLLAQVVEEWVADGTIWIERVEPSSVVAAGDLLFCHLNNSHRQPPLVLLQLRDRSEGKGKRNSGDCVQWSTKRSVFLRR